jgi:ABC-2 type transport system permease protein
VSTRTRAICVVVGGYLLGTVLWSYGVYYAVNRQLPGAEAPTWVAVLDHLNPLTALSTCADVFLPEANQIPITVTNEGATATQAGQMPTGATDSLVHEPLFLFSVLSFWIVVPLTIGYLRFRDADLP